MTKNKDENELLINGRLREELIGRIEVLGRVKGLLLLPNTEIATMKQVAEFYDVDVVSINSLVIRNNDELKANGYRVETRKNISNLLNIPDECLETVKGKTIAKLKNGNEVLEIPNRGLRVFPRQGDSPCGYAPYRVNYFQRGS
ncbi:hypothetical protein AB1L16_07980 [Peribacillus frigoritolerans]|uniref:hypothetical protein n=1 Tax=Peribacillus frigoritolerans TaxID=450367 RepID=UPI0039A0DAC3